MTDDVCQTNGPTDMRDVRISNTQLGPEEKEVVL